VASVALSKSTRISTIEHPLGQTSLCLASAGLAIKECPRKCAEGNIRASPAPDCQRDFSKSCQLWGRIEDAALLQQAARRHVHFGPLSALHEFGFFTFDPHATHAISIPKDPSMRILPLYSWQHEKRPAS